MPYSGHSNTGSTTRVVFWLSVFGLGDPAASPHLLIRITYDGGRLTLFSHKSRYNVSAALHCSVLSLKEPKSALLYTQQYRLNHTCGLLVACV